MTGAIGFPWTTLSERDNLKSGDLIHGGHDGQYIVFEELFSKQTVMCDLQTQTYETLPGRSMNGGTTASVNGVLYILVKSHKVQRLCLSSTSNWKQVESILEFRPYAVFSSKSSIYIIDFHKMIHCYDPVTGAFTEISKISQRVGFFTATIVADRVYIIGGQSYDDQRISTTVQMFDIGSQSWKYAPPLPKPLKNSHAMTVLNRWILVTGGDTYAANTENIMKNTKIYVFDTLTQQWSESNVELVSTRIWQKCLSVGSHMVSLVGGDDLDSSCSITAITIKHIIPEWVYERIKHFILIRRLVEESRATPVIKDEGTKKNNSYMFSDKSNEVMQKLIMEMNTDLFRNVLSFLIC